MFALLTTWKRGRGLLMDKLSAEALPLAMFIQSIEVAPPTRVEGTAVFMTSTLDRVPHALLHNLKHNKVLHNRVVFLTVVMRDIPYVPQGERMEIKTLDTTSTSSSPITGSRKTRTFRNCSRNPGVPASRSR